MPDSCMTAGSKPIYVSRIHTQNLNIPSRVSLNGSFDDQVKQHRRANLNSTRRKWSLFWKWTRCSDGHWAPEPVTSIASTIPFAFEGLHGCSSSFSSVFYPVSLSSLLNPTEIHALCFSFQNIQHMHLWMPIARTSGSYIWPHGCV
jgi:hypothetical protein